MNSLLFRKDRRPMMRMRTQVGGISTVDTVLESVAAYGLLGGIGYALWKHRWGWALASAAGFVGLGYLELEQGFADWTPQTPISTLENVPPGVPATLPASNVIPQGSLLTAPGGTQGATLAAMLPANFPVGSTVILNGAGGPQQYVINADGTMTWISVAPT